MQDDKLDPSLAKEGHVCCCFLAMSVWFYICIECCLTSLEQWETMQVALMIRVSYYSNH